jgi:hypothetical protein
MLKVFKSFLVNAVVLAFLVVLLALAGGAIGAAAQDQEHGIYAGVGSAADEGGPLTLMSDFANTIIDEMSP